MSAFGTKRTSASALHMSAFWGKADMPVLHCKCPLMTQSGHLAGAQTTAFPGASDEPCAALPLDLRKPSRRCAYPLTPSPSGAAVAWPIAAQAQQPERTRRIGLLAPYNDDRDTRVQAYLPAFKQRLHELGWIEGRKHSL